MELGRREPSGRGRRRLLPPAPLAAAAIIVLVAAVVRAVFVLLALLPLHDGVVEREERGQVGGDQRAAGGPPPRPRGQHAAALVERVLRLGDLLGGRLGRRLRQAREGFGLAGVEIREAPPAISSILVSYDNTPTWGLHIYQYYRVLFGLRLMHR